MAPPLTGRSLIRIRQRKVLSGSPWARMERERWTAEGPQAGLTHSRSLIVDPSVIVPALTPLLGPLTDMPPTLVTACMVGFVEAT